jgi:hypothetical protein
MFIVDYLETTFNAECIGMSLEGEEGDVCSCWMTLRKQEDTGS